MIIIAWRLDIGKQVVVVNPEANNRFKPIVGRGVISEFREHRKFLLYPMFIALKAHDGLNLACLEGYL